jgi:hypothetical protein
MRAVLRIRDPVLILPLDPGSEFGMKIPDHISESLEIIFWIKILKFIDADPYPGSGKHFYPGSGIRDKHRIRNTACVFMNMITVSNSTATDNI